MASEFLIKKAQEQSQGGQFNSNQSRTGGVKVSSFLTQKAAAQKTTDIPAAVGETVDTGSMTATNGLSADYLSGLLGMVQNLEKSPASAAALKTMGGYYSRPAVATGIEDINAQVSGLLPALEKAAAPVSAAMTELQSAEKSLKIAGDYLQRARDAYNSAPTQYNADQYNQIETVYRSAHEKYTEKYGAYSTLFQDYKTAQDQVSKIVGAYQSYVDYQNQQYDNWRGTIRDVSEIQRELDAVQSEIDSRKIQQHYGEDVSARLAVLEQRKTLLLEEYDWSQYFRYADLMNNEDFKAMSKYATTANGKAPVRNNLSGMYTETGFNDLTYDYINRNKEARGKALVNSIGDNTALLGLDKSYLQQMKDDEVATFNYLYATQGADAAYEYVAYLTTTLTQRQRMQDETYWAEYAKAHPVKSSMFSVLTSPMKGLSYLGQHADYWADGKIDQNAAYNKFSYQNSAIRGQVAKQIEESGSWGPVGSFAYQTGMSMGDFLFTTAITGGNQMLSLAIMGTGAAADTTIAAKDRGLEDWQAFTLGTVAGLAEVAMEKISLDALLNPSLLRNGSLKYIFKNMVAEGGEEVGTDVINLLADIIVAKDKSEWQKSIDNYVAEGLTEGEAFGRAILDQAVTMGLDFLGGFISGGVMSGGAALNYHHHTKSLGDKLNELNLSKEDVQDFIDTGLESNPKTDAYQVAKELQAKVNAGEEISGFDLSRLYQANAQAIRAENEADETAPMESADPVGLQLPSLENNNQALNTMKPETAVTLAQRLRQEQNLNGGIHNGSTDGRSSALDLARPGDGELRQGTGVLHGSSQRFDGQSAGEKVGGMAGSAERQFTADQRRTQIDRQNRIGRLRLQKVSSLEIGIQSGTDDRNIRVVPEEHWDAEMSQLAQRIMDETGKTVTYVMGRIQVRGANGAVGYARGVINGDNIFVQADNLRVSMEQIADHEMYHDKTDSLKELGLDLNNEIRRHIIETFSEEEFRKVLEKYIVALRGVYNVADVNSGEEYENMVRMIEEEVFADAYAGINAFDAGADKFTTAVNELMDQSGVGKLRNQENGTEQPTGPPSERFSYAGENANNADLDALAIAKEMQAAGVADETIRQETGWFVGMDGKWRWEIDDSKMKYSQRGDLGFRERNPGYARYRELLDKANRHVLELSDEAPTEAERAELNRLSEIWRGTFQKPGRITEDALPQDRLADYLQHDELFEAYPQLRKTTLRFADLPDGIRGQYDPSQNSITLDESLRRAPEDTLAHEIQHAIQNAEGFASGSSTRFWDDRQVAKPEYASEIQKAEQAVERAEAAFRKEWADDINLNLVKQYVELDNRLWDEETDPLKQQELADQMEQIEQVAAEAGWEDLLNDYYYAVGQLQMAKERAKIHRRTSVDLYLNTAGEIEARDVTARRSFTPDQRRSQIPARGDENTVFAENGDDLSLAEMDAEYGPQLQSFFDPDISAEEIDGNIHQVAAMAPVTQITGEEFAKGEKDLITQVEEFFAQLGNSVYNEQLGDVIMDRRGIKSDIAHGIGRKKAAAFAAVPDVISRGLIVDYQQNWKGRGYDTAVVAAPITIGTEDHIAAVVLTRSNQTNRFYVHEVLTTKNGAMPFKTGTQKMGASGGDAPSVISILHKILSVKNQNGTLEKYSMDSLGGELTPEQQKYFAQSQARDDSGRLLVLYHQTDGEFTIFDTRHAGAGSKDSDTPFGIFLKRSAGDIGLAGKKQMALYANITNPLRAANREDLIRQLREISDRYAAIADRHKQLDYEYHEKFEQAKKAWQDYITEWRAANPGANRRALNDDPKFNELFDAEDAVVDEWTAAADLLSTQAKEDITEDLRKAGYDGVFLENDVGSWGRRTDAIIALDPQQVKNISNKMPTSNPDIRYSVDDADDQVAIGDLQAELYQLQHQRRSLLEADTAYAAAADNLRYANTFTEKVAARKAMAAAAANINTVAIDQRIFDLNEQISEIRNSETRKHREDQEKYSGTKTAGYSTMPDTRLKDLDQNYMKAVRSGDRTRMAELVEQAAEAAMPASVIRDKSGRLLKTYHHTGSRFTVFDRNMARTGTEMDGFFFAPDPDSTGEYGPNMITAYLNITKLAMDPKLDRKFNDSGTLLREKLAYQGYDGVARTENGEIYEYMTFDPEQIKSADPVVYDDRGRVIPLGERFNFRNPDIRYSVDDGQAEQEEQQKPKKKTQRKKQDVQPVAESKPLRSKRELRNTVLSMFSIPGDKRAELGGMIDAYADRLIKNGSLTEQDRKNFFDRMYESGVMTVPADDFHAEARNYVKKGKIYVSESVRADFGDDWNSFRRQAFGAGVYLTSNRADAGIDQWNVELADALPGMFDAEDTDLRTILERIIQMAEEGKDEKLSLQEYTARLAGEGYVDENEFLDNMERQLDWALRTFAEKASLEVDLRDRTGKKIAQEREAFAEKTAERSARQKAKEAQRRADERDARKETAKRARDRKELRELQQKTLKQLQWLSKNRNRAPEELKATWDEVLGDIDLYAVSAADEMRWSDKHSATWKDLAQMYKDAMTNDPNFLPSKELERIVTRLDASKIADMDLGALQDLYKAAIGLRTEFYNRNNVINDELNRMFNEVYTDAKREIESAPGGFTGKTMDKFLNLDQLTPMNVLQRMAGWDPDSAFYSMAKQLERGERDMRAYSVKAQKMLQDFLTEREDWVKKADGQGKDAIWYEVEVPQLLELGMGDKSIFGPTVKVYMTPAQKVHMFLESKNLDNLRHMTGGRTFVNKDLYSQGKRQEALSQGRTIKLAPETVRKLVSDLTPEEMELAQILDRYYNTFATQEINKVSNILYGYDKAMGKNYAPIYTNRNYTKTEFGVFDTTAEGVGNLKGRQYAVNPSYNISAFDAFERHVDQTARFCGMAIPARNWTTLMNWREKNNSTGDVITHKWGEESKRYITDLITTLQAGDDAKSDTISSGLSKLQSNYITAIFGANPSIVLKQLGSIPLAGAYLDARNMPTPAQISKIDRSLISKYTQELEWRTMGYATPETKQLKDNPNWTQTNKAFKFVFGGGAITAMDGWAASTLWPWAENKVRREHPELAVGTKAQIDAGESAFYKKVAEEFENAISRSQSVSDEIHQGTLRKSKNPITKAFTMFRSDSAQTYNALRQKIGEARYYMRTGAKEKVIQTAKKAAGTAFVAMLINAAWSETVSFLMALWKNKGKYYRDDEDELTFQSVAGQMVSNMLGSYAGVVTGGEELFELIGNIITGDTWYGIETPGMEQLNDLLDTLIESGSGMRDLVAGGWDVLKNGGNLGDYFSKHSGEILGGIKDLAGAAAMYLSGMPASNLEAYLTGALKWVSPELGAAYDDLFSDTGKSDLAGMEGSVLEGRIGRILSDRNVSESDDTAAALATLYEAGYKTAIPSDTPTSVGIDGEKHSLGEYQQQAYDTIWGGIVADALDDMVASDSFKEADPKTQAKMLSNLYTYAAEQAKAELFDEYEIDLSAASINALRSAGMDVAECIAWNTSVSGMKQAEKFAMLRQWDMSDKAKQIVVGEVIGTEMQTATGKPTQYAMMLDALKQGMSIDEYLDMRIKGTDMKDYLDLVADGMEEDLAYEFANYMEDLETTEGDNLDDLTRWRACIDFSTDPEDQMAALSMVMSDAQMAKVEIAQSFGIDPGAYVKFYEVRSGYDADRNGSYKQTEVKAVIDAEFGNLSMETRAAMWQIMTGSSSAKNNPYSRQVGQEVLHAKAAVKKSEESEGLSLGNW